MSDKPVTSTELLALRDRIDSIDSQIQTLINERASCAQEVAEVKLKTDAGSAVFYRPEREAQVLDSVIKRNDGPMGGEDMAKLFREIMSACLALEKTQNVAYLGPQGTFTQQAALKHFGAWINTMPYMAIDEVFREVEAGEAFYGVVPVENSTEGVVNHTLDSFMSSNIKICGEVELRIHQNLMVGENTRQDKITRVYSHQQSLAQCRKWLDVHMPHAERVAVSSNSEAAKRVKSEWNSAAIAGEMAADQYGLDIIHSKIEDSPDNSTRFLIIGKQEVGPSGNDKTSVIVSMKNEPGALFKLLQPFHELGVDLTRIETRPSNNGNWSYVFFIDFKGHLQDDIVKKAMESVSETAANVQILGSYPIAVL